MTDSRETTTLAACPFCGGPAEYRTVPIVDDEDPNRGGEYAACSRCDASTRLWFPIKEDVRRQVIEAWNQRVSEAPREPSEAAPELEAARLHLAAAREELRAICKGRMREGGKEWRMTIPMRDTDSDVVFGRALESLASLIGLVDAGGTPAPEPSGARTDDVGCVFCGQRVELVCVNGVHSAGASSMSPGPNWNAVVGASGPGTGSPGAVPKRVSPETPPEWGELFETVRQAIRHGYARSRAAEALAAIHSEFVMRGQRAASASLAPPCAHPNWLPPVDAGQPYVCERCGLERAASLAPLHKALTQCRDALLALRYVGRCWCLSSYKSPHTVECDAAGEAVAGARIVLERAALKETPHP